MKDSIIVTHEGWFLFCPVYWSDVESEAVAKHGLWWIFDLAIEIQQFRNWCLSLIGIEGGFPFSLKELPMPKVVTK
jgi:hypothetical protein